MHIPNTNPSANQNQVISKRFQSRKLSVDHTSDRFNTKNSERRRQPDRRRQQLPISMSDRRKKRDRRQPKLLNHRSATPEKISSQKGRTIDMKV